MELLLRGEHGYVQIPLDTDEVPEHHHYGFRADQDPTTVDRWDDLLPKWQQMVRHMQGWMRTYHPEWSLQIHTDRRALGVRITIDTRFERQTYVVIHEIVTQIGIGLDDPIVL